MTKTCSCGRSFTTRSGAAHHMAVCPVERAASAAWCAAIEAGTDPWAARWAAEAEAKAQVAS